MFLPLVSILLSVSHGCHVMESITVKQRDPVNNTHVPTPKLLEDTTIRNKKGNDYGGNDYGDYIVGGTEVSPKYRLGYQAQVKVCSTIGKGCYGCGGTVIHSRYVMTAAHCFYTQDDSQMTMSNAKFEVVVGVHDRCNEGGQKLFASRVFEHEDYNNPRDDNDIAILELSRDIIFNDRVWPACLPDSASTDYTGKSVTVSGWGGVNGYDRGQPRPDQGHQCTLQEATLKITAYSDLVCSRTLRSSQPDSSQLCAYSRDKDSCQGDSGGPLTLRLGKRYVLLGVTSGGYGCADSRYAGIYARVQGFLPWINEKVPNTKACGTATAPTSAPNILSGDSGMLNSPGYPGNYPPNQDKTFPIVAAEGKVIQVTFQTMDIEYHTKCQYDYVMAKDEDGVVLMKKTCGSKKALPATFTSQTNKVQIIFHSDNNINEKGFLLSWKAVEQSALTTTDPKTVKSTTATPTKAALTTLAPTKGVATTIAQTTVPSKQEGILASQNFPSNYPMNFEKSKTISVSQGSVIKIKFISFDLEKAWVRGPGEWLCADYLSVKDRDGSVLMKPSCGSVIPKSFTSKTNEVIITFVTNYRIQKPGYQLSWRAVRKE